MDQQYPWNVRPAEMPKTLADDHPLVLEFEEFHLWYSSFVDDLIEAAFRPSAVYVGYEGEPTLRAYAISRGLDLALTSEADLLGVYVDSMPRFPRAWPSGLDGTDNSFDAVAAFLRRVARREPMALDSAAKLSAARAMRRQAIELLRHADGVDGA